MDLRFWDLEDGGFFFIVLLGSVLVGILCGGFDFIFFFCIVLVDVFYEGFIFVVKFCLGI